MRLFSLLFVCATAALTLLAAAAERRIVPLEERPEELRLPPLARVATRDDSGRMWRLTGQISGDLTVAVGDFELCLSEQGWQWHTGARMGKEAERVLVAEWQNGSRKLLLMLWDKAPGETGFAVGEERADPEDKNEVQEGRTL